ncbi:MAG: tape measure protein [Planctomycetota bacterium]|jgi:tape measure domain-containing protein
MPEVELKISSKNLTKQALQEIQKDLDATAKKLVKAAEESEKFGKEGESAFAKLRRSIKAIQPDFQKLAVGAGAISAGLSFLTKSFISSAVATQKMKAGLRAVSSSAKEAESQFKRLEKVASLPGLGLPEAVQGATRLQSVGMSAENAAKTLAAFGNALATVGKGRAELSLVVEQLAQMSAKGKILAEDLKPIVSQSGLVAKAMKQAFGTSNLEDIRKLGLSTKDFLSILVAELEKLPQVSGGVANSFENLSDNIEKIKSDFGTILLPTVVKITDSLSKLVEHINNLSDTQKSIIAWGTVVTAGLTGVIGAMAGLSVAIPHVISAVKALGKAVTFLAAHPILALATVITVTLAAAFLLWRREAKATENAMNDLSGAIRSANKEAISLRMEPAKKELADLEKQITKTRQELFRANEELRKTRRQFSDLQGIDSIFNPVTMAEQEARRAREQLAKQLELAENLKKEIKAGQEILDRKPTKAEPSRAFIPSVKEADQTKQLAIENARLTISLMEESKAKRHALAQLEYQEEVERTRDLLENAKTTEKEKEQLRQQLFLLEQQVLSEHARIDEEYKQQEIERLQEILDADRKAQQDALDYQSQMLRERAKRIEGYKEFAKKQIGEIIAKWRQLIAERDDTDDDDKALEARKSMIRPFAREVAALPFDFIRTLKQRHDLGKQLNERLISLEQEKNNRLQEIRSDNTLSVREKASEIERIEKESAERRANIERELMERKKALFKDYLKDFAAGIAQQIALLLQRKAAEKITDFALGKLGGAGVGSLGLGSLSAAIPYVGMALIGAKVLGFDNPVHDRLAQISGGNTAMLIGTSFDDPYNDMKAKLRGTYAASRDLGRRSADDMLQNFQTGFIQKAQTLNNNSENIPQFQLFINGRELHAEIRRVEDAAVFRERAI